MNDAVRATLEVIAARAPGFRPTLGVILGSGWHGVAERMPSALDIAYTELPAFPAIGVAGHGGTLRLGRLAGHDVALLIGRAHAYEHDRADVMKGAVRTLAALGVGTLCLTNAAGSLDAAMPPGSLMLISDHLNLPQRSPLVGEAGSERFVDMRDAYDPKLRAAAHRAAAAAGLTLHEGVYAWVLGPQFETPAEIRMLQRLGAQAVGMSTVPETILARHAGMAVLGLSMLTNMGAGLADEALSHAHTLSTAQASAAAATRMLETVITAI